MKCDILYVVYVHREWIGRERAKGRKGGKYVSCFSTIIR